MSDIDFDELDRAVASVLGPSPADPAPVGPQSVEPVTVTVTPSAATEPQPDTTVPPQSATVPQPAVFAPAEPVAMPIPEPPVITRTVEPSVVPAPVSEPYKPTATPAQALHSSASTPAPRGRFLDFVSTRPTTPPAATVPRPVPVSTGNSAFVSDIIAPKPAAQPPAPAPATPQSPTATVSEMPTPTTLFAQPEPSAGFFDGTDEVKPAEPVPSPFIPDAKVEKRPLGAFNAGAQPSQQSDPTREQLVAIESDNSFSNIDSAVSAPAAQPIQIRRPEAVPEPVVSPVVQPAADRAPKPRTEKVPKYGKGTLIWLTVAIAVFLIGAGVAASLYFLVLQ